VVEKRPCLVNRPLTDAESASLTARTEPTRSLKLRHALERLGVAVLGRRGGAPNMPPKSGDPGP